MKSHIIALTVEFIGDKVFVTTHRRLGSKVRSFTWAQPCNRPSVRRLERYLAKANDTRVVDVHLTGIPGVDYLRIREQPHA